MEWEAYSRSLLAGTGLGLHRRSERMDEYERECVVYGGGGDEADNEDQEDEEVVEEVNAQEDGKFLDIQLDTYVDFRSDEQQWKDFIVFVTQRRNAAEWIASADTINSLVDATISNEEWLYWLGEYQNEDEAPELGPHIREGIERIIEDEDAWEFFHQSVLGWQQNISEGGLQGLDGASILDELDIREDPHTRAWRLHGDIPWEEELQKVAQKAITEILQPESIPEEDRKCAICYEEFEKHGLLEVALMWEEKHLPVKVRCRGQHVLGSTCLYQWMVELSPRSYNCPMCRDKLVDAPGERSLNLWRPFDWDSDLESVVG